MVIFTAVVVVAAKYTHNLPLVMRTSYLMNRVNRIKIMIGPFKRDIMTIETRLKQLSRIS